MRIVDGDKKRQDPQTQPETGHQKLMTECLDDDAGREQDEDLNEHQNFGQSKDLPPQAGQDEGGEKMAEGREVHEHVPGASYVIYGRIEGKQESGL